MNLKIFLIGIVISNTVLSDTLLLYKGEKAPYDGLLFNKKEANELHLKVLENDLLKQKIESYNISIDSYKTIVKSQEDKINLCLDRIDNQQQSLIKSNTLNTIERVGYFLLGIGVTGLAIYGVKTLSK